MQSSAIAYRKGARASARVKTIQRGLADLRQGKQMSKDQGVDLMEYEAIVDVPYWAYIEKRFGARPK